MQQRFPLLTSVFVRKVIAGQADAQSHASVWIVTQEKSERVKVGGHAIMKIDEEGEVVQVVAELISLYEDHQGEAMCEVYLCYNSKQVGAGTLIPYFKPDSAKGFKKGKELVICRNRYTMPVSALRNRITVSDNIDNANDNLNGSEYFYRYEIDAIKKQTLPLRVMSNGRAKCR